VNAPLIVAGSIGLLAGFIHGGAGEVLVVRRLSPGALASSPFGGPVMTKAMIQATWHITTVAFFTLGVALLVSGSVLEGDAARAVGVVGAAGFTGFAAVALGLGAAHTRSLRSLLRHPGPAVLGLAAALAWLGAL
jgi:hypothetical protein